MAEIRPILVALSANLMGGFFAGRLSSTHPGLNGALAALVSALFGFAGLGLAAVYVYNQPGQIRSENAGVLAVVIVAAAVLLPLTVLCAFLGGRLDGYFRTRRAS